MYIKIRVKAGSKKETMERKSEDHFEISVREPAKRNLANKRILELVADFYKIPRGRVRIINGHQSPSKILSVDLVD